MKYDFAPGMPGYGTKGVDGSSGLLGMGFYFSEYDGLSNAATISSKIINNKLLFSLDVTLPGYPLRIYQEGDVFLDKNGQVFRITVPGSGTFVDTGTGLDTGNIFTQGPNTNIAPVTFTRYSNSFAYADRRYLLDTVNSATAISNYALAPSSANGIYGIGARDFSKIIYTDNSVNSYEPFVLYSNTNDTGTPEKSIALVKESDSCNWRLGNLTGGAAQRDVSLIFDFSNIYGNSIEAVSLYTVEIRNPLGTQFLSIYAKNIWLKADSSTAKITTTYSGSAPTNIDPAISIFPGDGGSGLAQPIYITGGGVGSGGLGKTGNAYLAPGHDGGQGGPYGGVYIGNLANGPDDHAKHISVVPDCSVVVIDADDVSILCNHLTIDGSIIFRVMGAGGTDVSTFWMDVDADGIMRGKVIY